MGELDDDDDESEDNKMMTAASNVVPSKCQSIHSNISNHKIKTTYILENDIR